MNQAEQIGQPESQAASSVLVLADSRETPIINETFSFEAPSVFFPFFFKSL